jgi:hypothetical protein
MGISIGDTCRSSNTPAYVQKVLAEDTGKSRALYVSSVFTGYHNEKKNNMLRFLGNSISDKPLLPMIETAKMHILPFAVDCSRHTMLMYLSRLLNHANEMMADKLTKNLFFCNRMNTSHVEDECLSLVFESEYGHADFRRKYITTSVPCINKHHPNALMTSEERDSFLSSSDVFDFNKCNDNDYSSWNNNQGEVVARRKFFIEFSKRGAIFLRPSEKFIQTVLAGVIASAFKEYEKSCLDVLASAQFFLTNLKQDIENTNEKIKRAKSLCAELEKTAGDKEILKQFKEVMQWH